MIFRRRGGGVRAGGEAVAAANRKDAETGLGDSHANHGRWRLAKALREFRLARLVSPSYTYFFHDSGCASVAQGQSIGFVNQRLWVQFPPLASLAGKAVMHGGPPAKWTTICGDRLSDRPLSGSKSFDDNGWADGRAANGIRL